MSVNLNLVGRLANEPEGKIGKNSQEFVSFSVAVNQFGSQADEVVFYNCTGGPEILERMKKAGAKKGDLVHISGAFYVGEYKTRNGEMKSSYNVKVYDWEFPGYAGKKHVTDREAS